MHRWQHLRRNSLRNEYLTGIGLVLVAMLILFSAFRNLTSTAALDAKQILVSRLAQVAEQARRDGYSYTVSLTLNSPSIRVNRWTITPSGDAQAARLMPEFSHPLPATVIVESTTLPRGEVVISKSGFTLSNGHIILRADDGSRAVLEIGAQ